MIIFVCCCLLLLLLLLLFLLLFGSSCQLVCCRSLIHSFCFFSHILVFVFLGLFLFLLFLSSPPISRKKKTQSERDGLQVEISQLRSELAGTSSDMQELQGRLATCEDQLQVTKTKTISDQTKHKHQAASLSDSMRKLQSQLEQTRSLLDTVQQQREMLKNDNQNLRSELDTMYKQRANGGL